MNEAGAEAINLTKPIGAQRRDLMFKFMNGHHDLAPICYQIYKATQCDQILQWLIDAKLTGKEFKEWFAGTHARSVVLLMAYVLKRVNHDVKQRPLIVGRDWNP